MKRPNQKFMKAHNPSLKFKRKFSTKDVKDIEAERGKLSASERNVLPNSDFAEPAKRKYPIENMAHARNALSRVSRYGSPSEKMRVRAAVHKKYPSLAQWGVSDYNAARIRDGEQAKREERARTSERPETTYAFYTTNGYRIDAKGRTPRAAYKNAQENLARQQRETHMSESVSTAFREAKLNSDYGTYRNGMMETGQVNGRVTSRRRRDITVEKTGDGYTLVSDGRNKKKYLYYSQREAVREFKTEFP